MERFPDEIVEHYDRELDEAQRITHGLGQLELLRTREIIRRHLPPGPLQILDVGGRTGIHAVWLADDGHHVHLIDPILRHVEQARRHPASRGSITAYFHHPDELRAEFEGADLEVVELVGVEGLAGWLPQLDQRWRNAADRELILWAARVVEAEPSLLGLSPHLLAVARPRKRA